MSTAIAIVDCNNMSVSCERVFRPALTDKPVIVLSNNDGCAVARSQEAKDLGVKMGQPWFQIRHLEKSHGLVALSSNYALYADLSSRFASIAGCFAPAMEVYSIDECFLDFSDLSPAVPDLTVYASNIRERILSWIGIPTCVGIGASKTMAKMANHIAKKNIGRMWEGVCDLTDLPGSGVDALLAQIDVGEVWGVGRKLSGRLSTDGIKTALDLKRADPTVVRSRVSVVLERTVRELNGVVCYPLESEALPQKQVVCSRSFGAPVLAFDDLAVAVRDFAATAAGRLRQQDLKAGQLQVFIQTSAFRTDDKQYSAGLNVPLTYATSDTLRLTNAALFGLKRLYKPGFKYAKAGVMLTELRAQGVEQADLFAPQTDRRDRLMQALDAVNDRFGRGTLRVGNTDERQAWHMQQSAKTPSYTTDWYDLPVAR